MRLERTLHWLSIRPSWSELGELLGDFFVLYVVWAGCVLTAFELGEYVSAMLANSADEIASELAQKIILEPKRALLVLGITVFLEEVVFRFIPLSIALFYIRKRPHKAYVVFLVLLPISAVFGFVHADNYDVITAQVICQVLLLQGMAGILLSILFLKYTGMRFRYVLGALCVSTAAHMLWNSFVIAPVVVITLLL